MNFDPKMSKNEHMKREKDGLDVWPDLARFAQLGFNSINKDDLLRLRWFGIYQQKPNDSGYFMWRIKLPGGRLTPAQLREIGRITHAYARGFGDITTRQDIQLHWMAIEAFPDAFARIDRAGLYTTFACGDTPRNTCSCPLDGVIKNQIVPLGNLVKLISDMYRDAGKALSNLPRKFKTAIGACPIHCHQPQINDLSTFGVVRTHDGKVERGLGVMVGGGLSDTPHYAQGLRIFIPAEKVQEQIPRIFMAIAELFRDADELRYKRGRARLKFLVADKGWRWVRDDLERRLGFALEHDDSIVNPSGALHSDHVGVGEQVDGLYYVGAAVPRGRWTADQMRSVADIAERHAAPQKAQIRLSQKQNLLLVNIPRENVDAVQKELEDIGLSPKAPLWRQSLVSCTGNQFCNLAVVETKERAREVLEYLENEISIDTPIMVSLSGCPNSCAQYQIADIGLTGIPSIHDGRKQDGYNILVGGCLGENPEFGVELFRKVPAVLVKKVIGTLVENYKKNRITEEDGEPEPFREFVARHEVEQLRAWAQIPEWTPPLAREKTATK